MQVYRGMDIGTAKPTAEMRRELRYHLLDLVEPSEVFTLARFQQAAREAITAIEGRGNRPMLVGGTGLYLRAIIDDLEIPGQWPDVRAALETEETAVLYERLGGLDPVAVQRMEQTNRRRIIRALEVCVGSGRPSSSFGAGLDVYAPTGWDLVALRVTPGAADDRIRRRYADQMGRGFLREVTDLGEADEPMGRTAAQALGYRQLAAHLRGEMSLAEALEEARVATRRFARRQRAWFERDPRLEWIDVTSDAGRADAERTLVDRWGPAAGGDVGDFRR